MSTVPCFYCVRKGDSKKMIGVKPAGFNEIVYVHPSCARKNSGRGRSNKKYRSGD